MTVELRGRTYAPSSPLKFGTRDSGTKAAPVRWVAAKGEHPVVSGGSAITVWHSVYASKHVFEASVARGSQELRRSPPPPGLAVPPRVRRRRLHRLRFGSRS